MCPIPSKNHSFSCLCLSPPLGSNERDDPSQARGPATWDVHAPSPHSTNSCNLPYFFCPEVNSKRMSYANVCQPCQLDLGGVAELTTAMTPSEEGFSNFPLLNLDLVWTRESPTLFPLNATPESLSGGENWPHYLGLRGAAVTKKAGSLRQGTTVDKWDRKVRSAEENCLQNISGKRG